MLHLPPNQDVEVHQVLHLPRHEKPTLEHQSTRFPLRLPRKVTTMCENAHGATTRVQSLEAPARGTQTLRACAVDKSNELAGHGRAGQRSKHSCFSTTVRTPSVSTLFGVTKCGHWSAPTPLLQVDRGAASVSTDKVRPKRAAKWPICFFPWRSRSHRTIWAVCQWNFQVKQNFKRHECFCSRCVHGLRDFKNWTMIQDHES